MDAFWVINSDKPVLLEGKLVPEGEYEWCAGELRFHASDGRVYPFYHNTAKEAVEHKIKIAQSSIEFEKEMMECQIKSLEEEKLYWVTMSEEMDENVK